MRHLAFLVLFSCAPTLAAPLHIAGGRLVGGASRGNGICQSAMGWERAGSTWSLEAAPDGTLAALCHLDLLGSGTPYYVDVNLWQWPDGHVSLSITVGNSGEIVYADYVDADSYAKVELIPLPTGGFVCDALARFAADAPPVDMDRRRAQVALDEADPTPETLAAVEALGHDDWRVREKASDTLYLAGNYAQLRSVLRTRTDLSLEQLSRLTALLTPVRTPEAVLAGLDNPDEEE